jgi:hypothetical protein
MFAVTIAGVLIHKWTLMRLNRQIEAQERRQQSGEEVDSGSSAAPEISVPIGFRYIH